MKRSSFFFLSLLILAMMMVSFYLLWLRPQVEALLNGSASESFREFAFALYPRLSAEMNRLPSEFFLTKADQVLLRVMVVIFSAASFGALWFHRIRFRQSVSKFWDKTMTPDQYDGLRVSFAIVLIGSCYYWYSYLLLYTKASVFYEPLSFLGLLDIPFPRTEFILLYSIGLIIFIILMAFNIRPRFFAIYAAVLFVVLQGFMNSFEKLDHHFAPITYAVMIFPFLVSEVKLAAKRGLTKFSAWPLQLIRIAIAATYFLSGLEKLFISGADWVMSDSFCQYLNMKGQPLGIWVSQYPLLCTLLPALALLFQLLFPLVIFYPRTRWFLLTAGILFHFGVWIMMGIGAPIHTWTWAYIFFLDMSWLGKLVPNFMKIRIAHAEH